MRGSRRTRRRSRAPLSLAVIVIAGLALPAGLTAQPVPQPPTSPPPPPPPPPVVFSPQITVPPAPPPMMTVQVPQPDPWKTWLPVGVAILSAAVAAFSAYLAWRNQNFGFRKDRAAVIRDIRGKQAATALQAFENNVAGPSARFSTSSSG